MQGDESSLPRGMIEYKDRLYFSAITSFIGFFELHSYSIYELEADPGQASARLVSNTWGADSMCVFGGMGPHALYLSIFGGEEIGDELYRYTGVGQPELVADINAGRPSSQLRELTVFNEKLFFIAWTDRESDELWWYDGANAPQWIEGLDLDLGSTGVPLLTGLPAGLFVRAIDEFAFVYSLYVVPPFSEEPAFNAVLSYRGGWTDPRHLLQIDNDTLLLTASRSSEDIMLGAVPPSLIEMNPSNWSQPPRVILSSSYEPRDLSVGPQGVVYFSAESKPGNRGREVWGYIPLTRQFPFFVDDVVPGNYSSNPQSFLPFAPPGIDRELLLFSGARNDTAAAAAAGQLGASFLWSFDPAVRATPTPSPTPSVSPSTTTTATPSSSATQTPSSSPSTSPTPSLTPSPTASATAAASRWPPIADSPTPTPSPSSAPVFVSIEENMREHIYMQVSISGTLGIGSDSSASEDVYSGGRGMSMSLETIRRRLPVALVKAAGMETVRGRPSLRPGVTWSDQFVVLQARQSKDLASAVDVLVRVNSPGFGPDGEPENDAAYTDVLPARVVRYLVHERLLTRELIALNTSTSSTTSTTGVDILPGLGAPEAQKCLCYKGAWTVPALQQVCPTIQVDARALSVSVIVVAAVVAAMAVALLCLGNVSITGAFTVASVCLQILDVVSDASFTYQLAKERMCENPGLVYMAIASIAASVAVNMVLAVVLLRLWPMDGMVAHTENHFGEVSAVAFLSLFGIKALDLLTSELFRKKGFSLYCGGTPEDTKRRREMSHRVRMLGIPQLVLEDVVQLVVQAWALSLDRRNISMLGLLALVFTALNILRHAVRALLSVSNGSGAGHKQKGTSRRSRIEAARKHHSGKGQIMQRFDGIATGKLNMSGALQVGSPMQQDSRAVEYSGDKVHAVNPPSGKVPSSESLSNLQAQQSYKRGVPTPNAPGMLLLAATGAAGLPQVRDWMQRGAAAVSQPFDVLV